MSILETARSKVKKVMADAEEAVAETDILSTLKQEHREVKALLTELVETTSGPRRKKLLAEVKAALVPHSRAEEKVVYRPLIVSKDKDLQQDGYEGGTEHKLADRLLAKLSKIEDAASPEFSGTAKVLKEMIEHHVKEEEKDIFSDVKDNFSKAERYEMNERFLAEKQKIQVN